MRSDMYRLTKYEKTRIIGVRAEQLAKGALPTFPINENEEFDPVKIAMIELEKRILPIIIVRTLPDGEDIEVRMENIIN